jgi:triosephosphate isomerase
MGKLIAGNWKMHKSVKESLELAEALLKGLSRTDVDVLIAPTSLAIAPLADLLRGTAIKLAGQNIYWQDQGAYTGEISAPLLKAAGASYVLVAHSERRQYFFETEKTACLRVQAALKHELIPVLCIGETLEEREAGQTRDVLESQLSGALAGFSKAQAGRMIYAYEPVWAIGTGITATDEQANEAHGFVRAWLQTRFGKDVAEKSPILYGGSVKPANAKGLLKQKDVDGALVGGASLQAEDFLAIINEA